MFKKSFFENLESLLTKGTIITSISGPILDISTPVSRVELLDSVLILNPQPFQRDGLLSKLPKTPLKQLISIYTGIHINVTNMHRHSIPKILRPDLALYRINIMYNASLVSEVSQLSSTGVLRTICLSDTGGLTAIYPLVLPIASPMVIPIGQSVLGRLFNVTASSMDGYLELLQGGPWQEGEFYSLSIKYDKIGLNEPLFFTTETSKEQIYIFYHFDPYLYNLGVCLSHVFSTLYENLNLSLTPLTASYILYIYNSDSFSSNWVTDSLLIIQYSSILLYQDESASIFICNGGLESIHTYILQDYMYVCTSSSESTSTPSPLHPQY